MHRISNSTFCCTGRHGGAASTKQPRMRFKVCDLGASEDSDAEPLLPDSISFFEPGDKTSRIKLLCKFSAKKNGGVQETVP